MPRSFIQIALLLFLLISCSRAKTKLNFIVGGKKVEKNSVFYKSVVSLVTAKNGESFCSGVVIADHYILTASHCLEKRDKHNIAVSFSNIDNSDKTNLRKIRKYHYYKKDIRDSEFPNFDIVILELNEAVPKEMLKLSLGKKSYLQQELTILGFGKTSTGCERNSPNCSGQLRQAQAKIDKIISGPRYYGLLKLQGEKGGACIGDSGGPALYHNGFEWEILGITSGVHKVFNRAVENDPENICESKESLYSSVAYYRDWIISILENKKLEQKLISKPGKHDSFEKWCLYSRADKHWQTTQRILEILSFGLEAKDRLKLYEDCAYAGNILELHIEKASSFSFPRQTQILASLDPLSSLAIRDLDFYFLTFGDIDFSSLIATKRIEIVSSRISRKSLCSLSKIKTLEDLRLSYIKNTDIDLSCFADNDINHLEISYSEVSNVEALRKFKNLKHLEVYGSKKPEWIDELKSIHKIIWEEE